MRPLRLTLSLFFVIATGLVAQDQPEIPAYELGPDSKPKAGVPQGEVSEFLMKDSKTFPGFERKWWLYLPAGYDGKPELPLMVFQDGGGFVKRDGPWRVPVVLDNLIHAGDLPPMAAIFINPGDKADGKPRKRQDGRPAPPRNRSVEYDSLGDDYATFLIDEVLPLAAEHVRITADPEGRGIGGSSSGGICAFTVAWERPDAFRKVFTNIGSFTNIRGGHVYPELVREAEKKPLRVFQAAGKNDLVNKFGSWPEANLAMAAALEEKGYDHKFELGEGAHNPRHGASVLPDALRWLWRDYGR